MDRVAALLGAVVAMNSPPRKVQGDLDTPRPVRALGGRITLEGWCFLPGINAPPPVRLAAGDILLPLTSRHARPDLARQHPDEPAAAHGGFSITGAVPAGVHPARLEAQLPDGSWQAFKSLCLAVEAQPFAAGLDANPTDRPQTGRMHVEGWALHPRLAVETLALRYGHQEIPCQTELPRSDVPAVYPDSPHATRSGFKSSTILSAGRGRLRLKARLSDGSTAIARTALEIAVATDENHGPEIDLGAARIGLPPSPAAPAMPTPEPAARSLNLLFVLHGSFASNSALHVTALANELAAMGHACVVAVTHDVATLDRQRGTRFRGILHTEAAAVLTYADRRGPDLVHAWTTRENVRRLTQALRQQHPAAKVVVHLEDNEQEILALQLGRSPAELARLKDSELDRLVPPGLSHPRRSRDFLAGADGVTVITEKLRELAPTARPCHLIRPAADARYFHPRPLPEAFRRILDRKPGEAVLFYHGNVHTANAAEMRELHTALLLLNRSGVPVTLIRTGMDTVDFLGDLAPQVAPHVLHLGQILHHHHLPGLMALADFFVQPGVPDAFNDYRFPSKLPEFFAIGRPVILPRTNLGQAVRHGQDAYVLERADAAGIAQAVTTLRADPAMCERLGKGAVAYAHRHFSWQRSAAELAKFYGGLTA